MSDFWWSHELQQARLLCPPLPPAASSHSCPTSQWCYLTISVVPFSSCPQIFLASESFSMSQHFTSGDQSTGASASTSVLPMNTEGWFLLGWTGLIFLQSKGCSRVFSSTTIRKHQFFGAQPSLWSNSHILTVFSMVMYGRESWTIYTLIKRITNNKLLSSTGNSTL